MSEIVQTVLPASATTQRQHCARLGDEVAIVPALLSLTDSAGAGTSNWDQFDELGFDTPNAAPTLASTGAGNVDGTRGYLITYYDSTRDAESNPYNPDSPVTIVASTDTIRVTFTDTNVGDNHRWTHRRVYRNDSDAGTTYYRLATVAKATGTYDDNATDATIRTADTIELDNDKPEAGIYDTCITHKGRIYLVGGQYYIFSKLNKGHSYPSANKTAVTRGVHGELRIVTPVGDVLVFYKDDDTTELHSDGDPHTVTGTGYSKTMTDERGCLNDRCAVNVRGTHYVMDTRGIYQSRGGTEENNISLPLEGIWHRINWSQRDRFCGVADRDRAMWSVALNGETECRFMFVLDLLSLRAGGKPKWFLSEYPFGIRDMCNVRWDNHATPAFFGMSWQTVATFITEYGYVGYLVCGYTDLVDPQLTTSGTATGGTTTTLVDSGGTFSRTNEASDTVNVIGAYVNFPSLPNANKPTSLDWTQYYRITGVSGTTLTVTPAMPAAPTGFVYNIGSIPNAVLKSPLMSFGFPHLGKTGKRILVEYQPGGAPFEIGYGFSMDRRGLSPSTHTVDEGFYRTIADQELKYIEMGGTLDADGRMGVNKYGFGQQQFRYGQVIFDATGPNKPVIIDAYTVEIKSVEADQ
jgi:hypothetical protein